MQFSNKHYSCRITQSCQEWLYLRQFIHRDLDHPAFIAFQKGEGYVLFQWIKYDNLHRLNGDAAIQSYRIQNSYKFRFGKQICFFLNKEEHFEDIRKLIYDV